MTALKTVSMYIRAAKTEAEEAGESTEGMAESVSKLREELLLLTRGKVDIQIDKNTFKSTFQVFRELSKIWDDLPDLDQANILERLGNKRNSSVVASLIKNWDDAEKALVTSQSAEGSALRENEKYLDSIQGHIDTLRAAWQGFVSDFVGSDFVKTLLSIAQGFLSATDAVVKFAGALPTTAAVAGIVALVKNLG